MPDSLELCMVMVPMWVLGTKLRSSGRATNTFNDGTISPICFVF